ncbi:MAG: hypothetical protein M3O46_01555 [Myxococcota bacterium]|nr:hypothetical protein [Myxococcota bacterium]
MKTETTTLEDVKRALEEQDRHLDAAYRAATDPHRHSAMTVSAEAIEHLRDVCEPRLSLRKLSKPFSGVRC